MRGTTLCTRIGLTSTRSRPLHAVRLDRTVDLERGRRDLARLIRRLPDAAGDGDLEAARQVAIRPVRIDALRVPSAGVGTTTVQPFSWRRARRGVRSGQVFQPLRRRPRRRRRACRRGFAVRAFVRPAAVQRLLAGRSTPVPRPGDDPVSVRSVHPCVASPTSVSSSTSRCGSGENPASDAHPLCALPVPAVGAGRRRRRPRQLADSATRRQPPGGFAPPCARRIRCSCLSHDPRHGASGVSGGLPLRFGSAKTASPIPRVVGHPLGWLLRRRVRMGFGPSRLRSPTDVIPLLERTVAAVADPEGRGVCRPRRGYNWL